MAFGVPAPAQNSSLLVEGTAVPASGANLDEASLGCLGLAVAVVSPAVGQTLLIESAVMPCTSMNLGE